ncbi:uncharacterized protein BO97DRAFT_423881 [Aspergillus homomorphus CBS 101889]|uniref:Uncharacterized protein n=1 Tax=Aspergillus homomorphus (strain CBS 101889) TaxID=1450537 RepID=A0A395HZS0_ASPHC|nr:hypothetical protein BO97DRAFT_423881 [Aspergillus homomorphus CBS 101889]RAL13187.1 hypothetical protein BO97DRAFT_423881 [Aspergillus homomorphus CBS 101889]
MSRAESALLAILNLADDEESILEPIYNMLQLSIMHRHFVGFAQSRSIDVPEERRDESGSGLMCPVCDKLYGAVDGVSRFFCPYDEEEDDEQLQWDDWPSYWEHQVQAGHVVCHDAETLTISE